MAIINSRADLDALEGAPEHAAFMQRLAGTIHKWEWQGGAWVLVTDESAVARFGFAAGDFPDAPVPGMPSHNPEAVSRQEVGAERDRRIALGCPVNLSTGKSFTMQTRPGDIQNIQALVTLAQVRQAQGDTTAITFRDAGNEDQSLTPAEMIEAGMLAFAHVDAHYKAAWTLKDTDPIPADYDADAHWP